MGTRGAVLAVLAGSGGVLCAGHAAALDRVKVTIAAASTNYAPSTDVDYDDVVRTLTEEGTVPPAVQQAESDIRAELAQLPKDKIPPLDAMFDYGFVRNGNPSLNAQGWNPAS